jgi:hypothetical protein
LVIHLEKSIVDRNNTTKHVKLTGKMPYWAQDLRTFGGLGILYTKQRIRNKLMNLGEPCMFLGYPEDHTGMCFKLYNPHRRACLLARNDYWLNRSYGDYYNVRADKENIQVNQTHRMMADIDLNLHDIPEPPSNVVTR